MTSFAAAPSAAVESQSQVTQATATPASRLSVWCDRLIEAGWLAAIIVVPLFFNIYSSRVFEPDKLTTLRSIALFMAMIWLVKYVEEWRNPNRDRSITWQTPLVLPTLITIVVYMVSTALSVAPRTSLLGSYQRLQGTYTTFSYIVIFLMVLQGLRTRAQLERLITLLIINSLPIAVYGVLQRLQLDPLPWGGDTVERVAGNMGNSIFIAAYLVMTFFVTLYRIADSFVAIFQSDQPKWSDVARAACYILITLFNAVVVLILAGSRGPQLGWIGGLIFFALLLVQVIRRRKVRFALTVGMVGIAVVGAAFLLFLNVTRNDPRYDVLRQFPLFKRLSTVVQTSDGTNAVRVLIWDGAVQLVEPHTPIQKPDGSPDAFNAIRPLIGYGPESMYVAYNRFYVPELAQFEARNASPDRSHNETWDSLVITGAAGFLAYMFLFGSVLFYGFRWIGLIARRFEAVLFVLLWIGGAAALGGFVVVTKRPQLFGVAVGGGVALGLALFLFISAIANARRSDDEMPASRLSLRDQMLLIAIVSTVIAHFVEIHTGIAIASTRSHFWILIGVMVVVGYGLLQVEKTADEKKEITDKKRVNTDVPVADANRQSAIPQGLSVENPKSAGGTRRQRRAAQAASVSQRQVTMRSNTLPAWFGAVATYGAMLGLVLGIMAFDFTNNSRRITVPTDVFIKAMTELPAKAGGAPVANLAVLGMFIATLIIGVFIIVLELRRTEVLKSNEHTLAAAALIAGTSLFVWVAFGTFIAGRLVDFITAQQSTVGSILGIADQLAAFPAYVYVLIAIIMIGCAFLLRDEVTSQPVKVMSGGGMSALIVGALIVPVGIAYSNLQPIAADITYKQASPWDQQGGQELIKDTGIQAWDLAIEHYRKAIDLARNEDFYYLWLGRALLEKAKSTTSTSATRVIADNATFNRVIDNGPDNWNRPTGSDALPSAQMSREDLFAAAKIILEEARTINPLNTDHSANLARMWRQMADVNASQADAERTKQPADQAKVTQLQTLARQRYDNASKEYVAATSLSPNNAILWNEWGSLYLSPLYKNSEASKQKLDRSVGIDPKFDQTRLLLASWHLDKAASIDKTKNAGSWRAEMDGARKELKQAIAINPRAVQAYTQLTQVAIQVNDLPDAISATLALSKTQPGDWNTIKNLAVLYSDTKQIDLAKQYAQQALLLAPKEQQASLAQFIQQLGKQ